MSKKVIIVGAGASVQEGIDKGLWDKIKEQTIWSCNYAFMTMPYRPARELWVDRSFFKNNIAQLHILYKEGIDTVAKENAGIQKFPNTTYYEGVREEKDYVGKDGIEKNKIFIGKQGFSGTFALHVAICEGFDEIFLLGFDYGVPPNKENKHATHYYQGKLDVVSAGAGNPDVYLDKRLPNKPLHHGVNDYEVFCQEKDIKIWNVSMSSNIKSFEKISYKELFQKCQNG